jgi:hypothetical protein
LGIGTRKEGVTMKLLSQPDSNPKVSKNLKVGVLTAPLHLEPAKLSGYNVCPMATAGCEAACLHWAGNPVFMSQKQKGRHRKTIMFFEQRKEFMVQLVKDIKSLKRKADKLGLKAGVRLNATSDIVWESVKVEHEGKNYRNLMELFPNVIFYDYTKRPNRKNLPSNYHITFSLAEDNDKQAVEALENGINVAVVFRTKDFPKTYMGHPVINGDEHDFRPDDPVGVIVGLKEKIESGGSPDTTGFVKEVA